MNLAEKFPYWKSSTLSITTHEDESSAIRKEMIKAMREFLDAEETRIDAKDAERIAAIKEAISNPANLEEPPKGYVAPAPSEEEEEA